MNIYFILLLYINIKNYNPYIKFYKQTYTNNKLSEKSNRERNIELENIL